MQQSLSGESRKADVHQAINLIHSQLTVCYIK